MYIGKKSLEELRRIYLRMKDSVFSSKGVLCKGNSSTLKSVLIDWFGKDTVMSDGIPRYVCHTLP